MSSLDDIKQMFFLECDELLEALNDGLADIENTLPTGGLDPEIINAVFRTVHSIKGGAASFGLEAIVRFSHSFETVLDLMRSGKLPPDADNIRVMHRCADPLADLVAAGRAGSEPDISASGPLVAQLVALSGESGTEPQDADTAQTPDAEMPNSDEGDDEGLAFAPMVVSLDLAGAEENAQGPARYRIAVSASAELFATGHDPVHLFRELASLGDLTVSAQTDAVPSLEELSPATPHMTWELELISDCSEEDVREVFEFVETLAEISVTKVAPEGGLDPDPGPGAGTDAPQITQEAAGQATHSLSIVPDIPPSEPPAETTRTVLAEAKPQPVKATKSTVRVDLDLVDSLINIVGELVINQSVLTQSFSEANIANRTDIGSSLDEYKSLALQIQECVMSLRAQSVKQLFQRMARIVRETSEVAQKSVIFETDGEDTEIDKTVIERLIEPLTHILRNAVDHGLETSEDRVSAGKSPAGTVRLSASHRSGRVMIEVSDDGAGINRARVFEIAAGKGLISPDAQLSDGEIDRLLFLPGFSTKAAVTDLSGRGVGMDVVQSAIRKLGGRVAITSAPRRGTTFSISLPLTLAVLDGMVVDVAGQTMVVPITAVVETIRPDIDDVHMIGAAAQVIKVRDSLVPIIELGLAFGYRARGLPVTELVLLLIETERGERWALGVDRIIDQRQVVIKSLEGNYGHVPGVAAATILGDGKIALIIDPEETARMAEQDLAAPAPLLTAIGE